MDRVFIFNVIISMGSGWNCGSSRINMILGKKNINRDIDGGIVINAAIVKTAKKYALLEARCDCSSKLNITPFVRRTMRNSN
ncbi:MAG: hypothetical protein PHE79_07500 [Eubacteriales bacterium]|nr:hypothetical protein [Eubacteriales bacterium]